MLAPQFPPLAAAGTFRAGRFCKYLPEFGWQPLVVSFVPASCPELPVDEALAEEVPPGTVVVRAPVRRPVDVVRSRFRSPQPTTGPPSDGGAFVARAPGARQKWMRRLDRALGLFLESPDNYVGWAVPAGRVARRIVEEHRPHAIFCTSPPHSCQLIAMALKVITHLPLVVDLRDPWARTPWTGVNEAPSRRRLHGLLEAGCVRFADRIILNTARLRADFESRYAGVQPGRFDTIPNGYDPDLLEWVRSLPAAPRQAADGDVLVCHAGSVYGRRDLRPLVEAVAALVRQGRSVRVEQIGYVSRPVLQGLQTQIRAQGLDGRVKLVAQTPHRQTLSRLAQADVLVLIQPDAPTQVPGKLFEMIMFGKPILALTGEGETRDLIDRYGLGVCASPKDPAAIGAALESLIEPGHAGEDLAGALAQFDGRRLAEHLARVLNGATTRR